MRRSCFLAGGLFVVLVLNGCSPPQNDPDLQKELSLQLKDPGSAQYQNVSKNPQVICGELNGKNSYGAYDGFEAFAYDRQRKELWLENSARFKDEDYGHFMDVLGRCDNHIDLLVAVSARTNARIDESFRRRR